MHAPYPPPCMPGISWVRARPRVKDVAGWLTGPTRARARVRVGLWLAASAIDVS